MGCYGYGWGQQRDGPANCQFLFSPPSQAHFGFLCVKTTGLVLAQSNATGLCPQIAQHLSFFAEKIKINQITARDDEVLIQ